MPPQLEHGWLPVERRHRVDAVRRVIHALNAQRALVFMNFHQRLKVAAAHRPPLPVASLFSSLSCPSPFLSLPPSCA